MTTPEIEPNGLPLLATPLSPGGRFVVASGAISAEDDVDYFSFQASAGSRIWILADTGGTNVLGADVADPFVRLLASDGLTVIEQDDDDGTGGGCGFPLTNQLASAIGGRLLTSDGTYYLKVESAVGEPIHEYKLFIALTSADPSPESEPNHAPLQANSLVTATASTGLRSGSLSPTNDVDCYSVATTAGSVLLFIADCDPNRVEGAYLGMDLLATNGIQVLYSTEPANRPPAIGASRAFCYLAPVSGTYFVRLRRGLSPGINTDYRLMGMSIGPGALQFSATTFSAIENAGNAVVTVARSGGSLGTVAVRLDTANGTANAPGDYTTVSRILTFTNGVTSQTVPIPLVNDVSTEANEIVLLTLSQPTGGAVLGDTSTAVLVILDDDEVPNNAPATATLLDLTSGFVIASNATGSIPLAISPPGDTDWFKFTVPGGASLWAFVDTGLAQHPGANSGDSVLTLYAADGVTIIERDDDDGSATGVGTVLGPDGDLASSIASRMLNAGGTYYLRVSAYLSGQIIDPYRLFLVVSPFAPVSEVEPNDEPGVARPLVSAAAPEGQALGRIAVAGDADYYSVVVPSNGLLYVSLDCGPYRNGGGADLVLDMFLPDGTTRLFSADSSGSEPEASEAFCFQPPGPGAYFIRVRHFSSLGTGTYRLMVVRTSPESEPNGSTATAVALFPLDRFVRAQGSISPAGDVDFYSFVAPPGARLWATVDTGGPQGAGATSRDSILTVLAADGVSTIEEDDHDGSGNGGDGTLESGDASVIAGRPLSAGGNYFLRVRAAASGVINPISLYAVVTTTAASPEVEPNNSPDAANALLGLAPAVGQRSGTLTAGDADYYSVAAWAGNVLHFCADGDPERDGGGTDLILDLFGPDGSSLLFSANSSGAGSFSDPAAEGLVYLVPATGAYWVRVRPSGASTGTYTLLAARDNTVLQLLPPEVVGNAVRVRFPSQANRNYQLDRMDHLVSPPAWQPVRLFQGTGGVLQELEAGAASLPHRFYRVWQVP